MDLIVSLARYNQIKLPILIPLTSMLDLSDLKRKKRKTGSKKFEFELGVQLKDKYKLSGEFWSDFCGRVIEIIILYMATCSKDISFFEDTILLEK